MTTYADSEASVQDSAPIELYTFASGLSTWNYTSSEADYTDTTVSPSVLYTSIPLERDDIEATEEEAREALNIDCPRTFPVVDLFRVIAPIAVVSVVVREVHRGESDFAVIWMGRVMSASIDGAKATLQCEPLTVSESRVGPNEVIQRSCGNTLFDANCGLDPAAWDHATTVTVIDGLNVTVDSLAALPYGGGEITWADGDGNTQSRFIESYTGLVLKLSRPLYGVSVSDAVVVYPGCAHDTNTCLNTYSNLTRYKGRPHLTTKNPMSGEGIF